ncbi:uncharacterized protein F4812DRAFT_316920 [Daldinia caldariorum]|uniref:uncharacterized protein n=1 Tax=Daldinia caldariorum TaxID=326644 RepID=UPI00200745FC|nr:uncharacterized protein F4812DRAFT_316920 [Daldinia caldariorum]KAI1470186.1 hypothetical protein F4812DRAFT_316920 [Daldinia caldariorum]
MFDRLRSSSKDQGAPSLDRKKLEAWQKSRSRSIKGGDSYYSYSIRGGAPPPPRPPIEPVYPTEHQQNQQNLQPAPPVQAPNQHRNSSYLRPVSSIYSQPSPAAATFAAQQLRVEVPTYNPTNNTTHDPNEVSPPSSPDVFSPQDEPNPGDVSPIDDTPDMSQLAIDPRGQPINEARTKIPAARRERRKNSDAAMNALREAKSRERLKQQQRPYGQDVRWNPRTGEPTTDSKGTPSQTNPQQYAQGLAGRPGSVSPTPVKPANQGPISFRDQLRRVQQPNSSTQPEPTPRPAWRGASGRTTLVAPVNDTKDVAPLKIPRRSSKRAARDTGGLSRIDSVDSELTPQPQSPNIQVTNPSADLHTYPSPPLSDDNTAGNHRQQSLQVPSNNKAVRRKPTGTPSHQHHPSTSSSVYSQPEIPPAQAPPPDTSLEGWTQPPSRFSVTTHATSDQSTHGESIEEGTPAVPTPQEPSILARKRPVVSGYENSPRSSPVEPVKISLDSYYMTGAGGNGKDTSTTGKTNVKKKATNNVGLQDNSSKLTIISVADKSLPPAPPETQSLEARDRVAQLDARLRALGNRRINLNTAIKQMTELMPTDHILASDAVVRRREEEKRKVEALRLELADVERESYELGLKLHRAYKRLDRDAEYEPTTLWVRRVTG